MDFSGLSDEQLLMLIKAAMAEAVGRGEAMARAASDVYVDAGEELRAKARAAEQAAKAAEAQRQRKLEEDAKAQAEARLRAKEAEEQRERQAALWSKKAAIFAALKDYKDLFNSKDFEKGFQVNIWQGSDIRVYIQEGSRSGWEIVYYHTGNRYHPPGSVTGVDKADHAARIAAFCEVLCRNWNPDLKIHSKSVLNISPHEKHLADYRAALKLESPKEGQNV